MLLDSLIAVFGIILIGYALKRTLIREESDWRGFERISYYVLVPALLIHALINAKLSEVPVLKVVGALFAANLIMASMLLALRPLLITYMRIDNPAFTSVFQAVLRWNAFIALAIAGSLYGAEGVTLTSLAIGTLILLINVQSVMVLQRYGNGQSEGLLKGLATNPYIIGSLVGIALNLTGLKPPASIAMLIDILGKGALGAGLLLVGAGLRLGDLQRPGPALALSTGLRLLLLPLMGGGAALAFGLNGTAVGVVVICLGVPTASAGYLLARKMGGDAPLLAAILTAQTVLSAASLPFLLWLFSGL